MKTITLTDQQGETFTFDVPLKKRLTMNSVVTDPDGNKFTIRGRQHNPKTNTPIPNKYIVVWTDNRIEHRRRAQRRS